jgi:hypothetical protein
MKQVEVWKGKKDGPDKEQNEGHANKTFAFCPAFYLSI